MPTDIAPDPPSVRPYVSHSQVSTFIQCPLKFCFRYVENIPETRVSSALILGGAVHRGLEMYHLARQEKKPRPGIDQLADVIQQSMTEGTKDRELVFGKEEPVGGLKDEAMRLLRGYMEQHHPNGEEVIGVEQELGAEIAPYLPPATAIIDLIERFDHTLVITDFKTSGQSWSEAKAKDGGMQLALYKMAVEPFAKDWNCQMSARFVVLVRNKTVKIQEFQVVIDNRVIERVRQVFTSVFEAIERRLFWPNPSFMCPSCPYSELCDAWPV
jgi:putative RecB family exonuclease